MGKKPGNCLRYGVPTPQVGLQGFYSDREFEGMYGGKLAHLRAEARIFWIARSRPIQPYVELGNWHPLQCFKYPLQFVWAIKADEECRYHSWPSKKRFVPDRALLGFGHCRWAMVLDYVLYGVDDVEERF